MSDTAVQPQSSSDRVLAIVFLVGLGLAAPFVSFAAIMLAMVSDSCGITAECSEGGIAGGVALAAVAPWVALIGGIIVVVVRSRQGRVVWWVPIVAGLIGAGLFVLGAYFAFDAVN